MSNEEQNGFFANCVLAAVFRQHIT